MMIGIEVEIAIEITIGIAGTIGVNAITEAAIIEI
jgi:hypothetical protein